MTFDKRTVRISVYAILVTCIFTTVPEANSYNLFNQRIQQLKSKADAGDKRSQYKLGVAYMTGTSVKFNTQEALKWLNKSANQDYPKAWYRLGQMHHEARYGMHDRATAFKYFNKAASNNHGMAQYFTALYYYAGKDITQEIDSALLWAARSKRNGIRKADKLMQRIRKTMRLNASTQKHSPRPNRGHPLALNSRRVITIGKWRNNNQPSDYIPSISNHCVTINKKIRCTSRTIRTKLPHYKASFKIVSLITNFKTKGNFTIRYRKKYLFIEKTNSTEDQKTPSLGLDDKVLKLQCHILNGNKIDCSRADRSTIRFTKR